MKGGGPEVAGTEEWVLGGLSFMRCYKRKAVYCVMSPWNAIHPHLRYYNSTESRFNLQ